MPWRQEVNKQRGRGQSHQHKTFLELQQGYCGHQHVKQLVPEQFSPSAENSSGGENVVQEELAAAADNTSCLENLNNPDGANGVNETETGRNTNSGQTGSHYEGLLLCFNQVF